MEEKMVLTLCEAAKVLGVSRQLMMAIVNRDDFPAMKIGRRWAISPPAMAEWAKANSYARTMIETNG